MAFKICLTLIHPYEIKAVYELKPGDSAMRVVHFRWILNFLDCEGEDNLDVTFFTGVAYFHLSKYINTYNSHLLVCMCLSITTA